MSTLRLITHGVLMGAFVAELGALALAETHTLVPTPKTVSWGYFDARTPPVLRVNSGDTVDIEALIAAAPRQLEAAGVPREKIQQALIDIDREVTERGEIPHILTGPIYVDGARPGDVLEVRILSVDLTIPYAVTFFMPGRGFLPDEFPYFHARSIPLDMTRKVADFAPGIEVPIRPFFGVIGVAPPPLSGRISSGPPWIHTGNMDNKELIAGSTLYVPVHAQGAVLRWRRARRAGRRRSLCHRDGDFAPGQLSAHRAQGHEAGLASRGNAHRLHDDGVPREPDGRHQDRH
jgi:hypothetical protein